MGLTGALKIVSTKKCGQCNKDYGSHSKKAFMRCLYTANYNMYQIMVELNTLKNPPKTEVENTEVKNEIRMRKMKTLIETHVQ